jgi:hypothetical protein
LKEVFEYTQEVFASLIVMMNDSTHAFSVLEVYIKETINPFEEKN